MKLCIPKCVGARVAIFGSGPSLEDALRHPEKFDLGIAVNGAIKMEGLNFDFFQSNHGYAHLLEKGWQRALDKRPETVILMNSNSAPYWIRLFPDPNVRAALQKEHQAFLRNDPRTELVRDGATDHGKPINNYFSLSVTPVAPHVGYDKIPISVIEGNLLDQQEKIIDGASSAGAAVHAATLMGASEIVLFGVQMTNASGGNYAFSPNAAEMGRSSDEQRENLDRIFGELHGRGIPITIYGDHAFESGFLRNGE